ncbi:hypothetical protein GALMADRAFT_208498 [Galerina marginata CBS 339.88]|uniref:Uncharacterized protein n=1 Tax=Galerina marginata (strain CBS 339.88) TaxID=685588 RepID=A0A067TB75_GALM3|nr:hypothetical protein GALMADRAFT_208498 [Galerina marginata CBS 339.88]
MRYHPSASIPAINYACPAPYSSLPRPPPTTILYDRVYNDDHLSVKCHLRQLLKKNKLSGMPAGYPFHCVHDGQGGLAVSRASYEFREHFCFSDQRARIQHATFTFSAPDFSRYGSKVNSWRIYLPARESTPTRDAPKLVSIAHVQVDQLVMETPDFGFELQTNPRILLEALALSIELGVLITVQVANYKTPMTYPSKRNVRYGAGEIIFISTDDHGRSEVALVFEP